MANEVTLNMSIVRNLGSPPLVNYASGDVSINETGSRSYEAIMSVTTGATALIPAGQVGTLGYILIQNLDTSTNGVTYILKTTSDTTGAAVATVMSNELACFKAGGGVTGLSAIAAVVTSQQLRVLCLEL